MCDIRNIHNSVTFPCLIKGLIDNGVVYQRHTEEPSIFANGNLFLACMNRMSPSTSIEIQLQVPPRSAFNCVASHLTLTIIWTADCIQ